MLFVIAMLVEDKQTGAISLVQDMFTGVNEDEALGKAYKIFEGYGSINSYKLNIVSTDNEKIDDVNDDLTGLDSLILSYLQDGHKIQAIKRHREITGCGLKESKHCIDVLIQKYHNEFSKFNSSGEYRQR